MKNHEKIQPSPTKEQVFVCIDLIENLASGRVFTIDAAKRRVLYWAMLTIISSRDDVFVVALRSFVIELLGETAPLENEDIRYAAIKTSQRIKKFYLGGEVKL